ncbi:hypothetical protein [Mycoplasma sp. P36-A1]|uniref:hypothetical protein n=1 Tax=Mycoplasma sp. P36-A1 TaxID=3252900 RepID=UPI003C2CFA06
MNNNVKNKFGFYAVVFSGVLTVLVLIMAVMVLQTSNTANFQDALKAQFDSFGIDISTYGFTMSELISAMKQAMLLFVVYLGAIFICGTFGYRNNNPRGFLAAFILSILFTIFMVFSSSMVMMMISVALTTMYYFAYKFSKFIKQNSNSIINTTNEEKTVIDIDAE